MLLELGERFPQRGFPEQDQLGQALLFDRSHPALRKSVGEGCQLHGIAVLAMNALRSPIPSIRCEARSSGW